MEPWVIFRLGGPVMWVLFCISILAMGIVLAKIVQFYQVGAYNDKKFEAILGQVFESEEAKMRFLDPSSPPNFSDHPAISVIHFCLHSAIRPDKKPEEIKADVQRMGSEILRNLESYLRGLAAIAHISPLLGLLGTVFGMIQAFQQLQMTGAKVDPAVLAGGIWSALMTTAAGLTIAIPVMACLYYLESVVDRIKALIQESCSEILTYHGKI